MRDDLVSLNFSMLFLDKVRETIARYDMLSPGDKVVVGVSGGPDSIALLYALNSLRRQLNLKLHVAHLNHMFRSKESKKDLEFVVSLARRLKIPVTTEEIDVKKIFCSSKKEESLASMPASSSRTNDTFSRRVERGPKESVSYNFGSLEEASREIRYDFLLRVARKVGAKKIAVGHTKDDQAQTVLMRIIRGSGLEGLGGIHPVRATNECLIIRPLIELWRRQIEDYLKIKKIKSRIDSSNLKDIYYRNKIRLYLLPLLEKEYNPNIKELLTNMAQNLRTDFEFFSKIAQEAFKGCATLKRDGGVVISLKRFSRLHPALQKQTLRQAMKYTKGNLKRIDYRHWEQLDRFFRDPEKRGSIYLPMGLRAQKRGSRAEFFMVEKEVQKKRQKRLKRPSSLGSLFLNVPGVTEIPDLKICIRAKLSEKRPSFKQMARSSEVEYIDYDKAKPPILIRTRIPGDRFRPLGMMRYKKLKDFFIDEKVPAFERDRIPLLLSNGRIIWVVGKRIAESVKITPATRKVLRLEVIRRYKR